MAKVTTGKQYEVLVLFMEEHPDLAKGYNATTDARVTAKSLWSEISTQLNSQGPPIRDPEAWKKVWADFKFHIKKKLKINKMSMSGTGGGPSKMQTFSPVEESVIRLIDLRAAVEGISGTLSFGDTIIDLPDINSFPASTSPINNNRDVPIEEAVEVIEPRTPLRKKNKESLLEQQIKCQKKFHEDITNKLDQLNSIASESHSSIKRLVRLKEKSYDLKKRQIQLKEKELILREKEIRIKEKQILDKNKFKLQDLEIKKHKLELQESQM